MSDPRSVAALELSTVHITPQELALITAQGPEGVYGPRVLAYDEGVVIIRKDGELGWQHQVTPTVSLVLLLAEKAGTNLVVIDANGPVCRELPTNEASWAAAQSG